MDNNNADFQNALGEISAYCSRQFSDMGQNMMFIDKKSVPDEAYEAYKKGFRDAMRAVYKFVDKKDRELFPSDFKSIAYADRVWMSHPEDREEDTGWIDESEEPSVYMTAQEAAEAGEYDLDDMLYGDDEDER